MNIEQATEVLRAGRAVIEDRSNWTTRQLRNRHQQYCALGALHHSVRALEEVKGGVYSHSTASDLLDIAANALFDTGIIHVNDSDDLGHEAVLECYDYAIKLCDTGQALDAIQEANRNAF